MKAVERNDTERARRYFEDKLAFTTGPAELSKAMKEGAVVVVDVRAAKDFNQEHIVGSINLPEDQWSTERGLDRDRRIVVLCYSQVCHLAARAAVEFARRGYSVVELEGGFPAWKSHGLPTEGGDATANDPIDRTRSYLESRRAAERESSEAKVAPEPKAPPEAKGTPAVAVAPEAKAAPEPQVAPVAKGVPVPTAAPEPQAAPEGAAAPEPKAAPAASAAPEPKAAAAPKDAVDPSGQTAKPQGEPQPRPSKAEDTHRSP